MSHASAKFYFPDGTVLFGEYNGTADVMLPRMYATADERNKHWRGDNWRECNCTAPKESWETCIAESSYGGGFWWPGTACRKCMAFVGPLDPEYTESGPFPFAAKK